MHDPAAIMAITDPDIFTFQKVPLSVIMEGEKEVMFLYVKIQRRL